MSSSVLPSPTGGVSPALSLPQRLAVFAGDIKISHTVFALPFALLSTFLAASALPGRTPAVGQVVLILLCMVTARTLAMAMNRLLDARLDRINPRTARRAIPSGALTPAFYVAICVICIAGFFAGWLAGSQWKAMAILGPCGRPGSSGRLTEPHQPCCPPPQRCSETLPSFFVAAPAGAAKSASRTRARTVRRIIERAVSPFWSMP